MGVEHSQAPVVVGGGAGVGVGGGALEVAERGPASSPRVMKAWRSSWGLSASAETVSIISTSWRSSMRRSAAPRLPAELGLDLGRA